MRRFCQRGRCHERTSCGIHIGCRCFNSGFTKNRARRVRRVLRWLYGGPGEELLAKIAVELEKAMAQRAAEGRQGGIAGRVLARGAAGQGKGEGARYCVRLRVWGCVEFQPGISRGIWDESAKVPEDDESRIDTALAITGRSTLAARVELKTPQACLPQADSV